MSEVQIFDVAVNDVHGNAIADVVRVYARNVEHAEDLAEREAAAKYPLNQMGCARPVLVGRSACWRCGATEIFDGNLRMCEDCGD